MIGFLSQLASANQQPYPELIERRAAELRRLFARQLEADKAMQEAGAHMVVIKADGTIIPIHG